MTLTLSKVENERLSLSYDRLIQVARGFDMSLSEFLAEGDNPGRSKSRAPASGRMCVERAGEGSNCEERVFDDPVVLEAP